MRKNYAASLLLWMALVVPAFAANVNIDALPAASSVATGDLFECEQGGTNRKCTSDLVKTFAAAQANHPGYSVNINGSQAWWMPIMGSYSQAASGAYSALTAYCTMGQIGGTSLVTVSGLGTRGTTGGSTNVQFALYNNDTTPSSAGQYAPGTLIVATGNIVNTGTGNISGATLSNVQVSPGFYWFCMQSNDTTFRSSAYNQASLSFTQAYVGSNGGVSPLIAFSTGLSTTTGISSFGTWPTFHGATFSTGSSLPMIGFSLSSIP
jgi:hypothetical protein